MGPGNGTFFSFVRHHSRLESGSIQGINIYIVPHRLDSAVSSSGPMEIIEFTLSINKKAVVEIRKRGVGIVQRRQKPLLDFKNLHNK